MAISYNEAWNKAGYYLTACSGFPPDSKFDLQKSGQTYLEPLKQHKVVFTLLVYHPQPLVEAKDPTLGINQVIDKQKSKEIDKPFKLMRELLAIIEQNKKTKAIASDEKPKQ